jgi:MEMO1 family protein
MPDSETRPPAVAGQFYDADPIKLKAGIEGLLEGLPKTKGASLVRAVILPHAGYVYSGPTAVKTLATAIGGNYGRAVVIAPSHRIGFEGLATAPYKALSTPLGDVPVDCDAMAPLLDNDDCPFIRELRQAHAREHALEVELPLLQTILPPMPVVPLICGQLPFGIVNALAKALLPLWNRETLWVISSDFTHYGESFGYVPFRGNVEGKLRELDLAAVQRILEFDLEGFNSYIEATGATICGKSPIELLLAVAGKALASGERLSARLVDYSNSGESTGEWSHCVGYAGIAIEEG